MSWWMICIGIWIFGFTVCIFWFVFFDPEAWETPTMAVLFSILWPFIFIVWLSGKPVDLLVLLAKFIDGINARKKKKHRFN